MSYIQVAKVSEIPKGSIKSFTTQGKKIAIANIDGEFFAIADTCSHEQCSLGTEGFLDGSSIICGCHGASFDVTNGKALSLPAPSDVVSYKIKVENGDVLIEL